MSSRGRRVPRVIRGLPREPGHGDHVRPQRREGAQQPAGLRGRGGAGAAKRRGGMEIKFTFGS